MPVCGIRDYRPKGEVQKSACKSKEERGWEELKGRPDGWRE